uniref:hypothetical protein n=1 Tax=uncultured Halomonas sp. TaxID=173971 RepID=UPI0026389DC9
EGASGVMGRRAFPGALSLIGATVWRVVLVAAWAGQAEGASGVMGRRAFPGALSLTGATVKWVVLVAA